jgi:hypothetical protein
MSDAVSARADVVITTRLPPQICGVGAYSWLAHKHAPDGRDVEFLVMDGAAESRSALEHHQVTEFNGDARRLQTALGRAGGGDVLLHYAARGYQRFGCPTWLPSALTEWKSSFPSGRLTVFFHEVPGDVRRLSHHFVLAKINEWIIRRLAQIADVLVTNTEGHAAALRKLSGRAVVHCIPVGSNIEPPRGTSAQRADAEFVVFGLPFGRRQTLQAFGADIATWHDRGVLRKLHLIGPEDRVAVAAPEGPLSGNVSSAVVRHGTLAETDVSRLLSTARFALTNVTRRTWSKSGSFMACAAHGCIVVTEQRETEGPLRYALAKTEVGRVSTAEIESRAAALKGWYVENAAWAVTARRLSALSHRAAT